MEISQLTYFLAVAEEGGFTAAARREHVVQSTVSAAIARLERELDQRLFERADRRATLTTAGAHLCEHARAILNQISAAHEDLASLRGGLTGSVVLGTLLSHGDVDLSLLLHQFTTDHPGVAVSLRHLPGSGVDHLRALSEGRVDLALIVEPVRPPHWATVVNVGQIRLRLVCAVDDPLARRRRVGLADLAARAFVDFPPGWGNRSVTDAAFDAIGVRRSVAFEVADIGSALSLISAGIAIGFVPQETVANRADIALVRLAPALGSSPLALISDRRRPEHLAVEALRERFSAVTADRAEGGRAKSSITKADADADRLAVRRRRQT